MDNPDGLSPNIENNPVFLTTPKKKLLAHIAAGGLICFFFAMGLGTIRRTSQTVDEFVRVAAAASYLETGDLRIDPGGTSPLIRRIIGAPLAPLRPEVPEDTSWQRRNMWVYGWDFMIANHRKYIAIVERARLPILICAVMLCLLLFAWGARRAGLLGGLISLGILCLDPNFMAHASIAGTDVQLTLSCVLVFYFLYRWFETPRWLFGIGAGAGLGLGFLSKFSAGMVLPAIVLFLLAGVAMHRRSIGLKRASLRAAGMLLLIVLTCLLVINAACEWRGMGDPLGNYHFQSAPMRAASRVLASVPSPFPRDFLQPFDASLHNTAGVSVLSYFKGKRSYQGWWDYYFTAWAIKTPIPVMLFLSLGLYAILRRKHYASLLLLLPPATFLFWFSFVTKVDFGFRYLLPMLPFQALLAGEAAALPRMRPVCLLLLLWALVSLVRIHPNHIAYFNEFIGGPRNGHHYLIDSNLDWGQNLPALRDYMRRSGIPRVYLAHYGYVDPKLYGVENYRAPCEPVEGTFAVSPQYYYDVFPFQHRGGCFDFLREKPPDDMVAYTWFIYHFGKQ